MKRVGRTFHQSFRSAVVFGRSAARSRMPRWGVPAVFATVMLMASAVPALADSDFGLDAPGGGSSASGAGGSGGGGSGGGSLSPASGANDITPLRDLTTTETRDLLHQLQLANGVQAPVGGGWVFVPMITVGEEATDNVYQVRSPRRADLISFIAPGFQTAADMPRLQLTATFAPAFTLYANTSSLNALTDQLNALATVTLEPDLLFVDLSAFSGVNSIYGGYGGIGNVGASANNLYGFYGNGAGGQETNRQNEAQTSAFTIRPRLTKEIGDYGVGQLTYTLSDARSNPLSGFTAVGFRPLGGGGQNSLTNDLTGTFTTGELAGQFQDTVSFDLARYQTNTAAGFVNGFTGETLAQSSTSTSSRIVVNNQLAYMLDRETTLTFSLGHENITYSGNAGGNNIDDVTWRIGAIWTPNPDSQVTLLYGHWNGETNFNGYATYALTGRTSLNFSYDTLLGTQLEYLQSQFNGVHTNATGQFVNAADTQPIYVVNTQAQQEAVFRSDVLSLGTTTSLDRDVLSLNMLLTRQSTVGAGNPGVPTQGATLYANWIHALEPDMNLFASASVNQQKRMGSGIAYQGNYDSYAARLGWTYEMTETLSVNVSYSFFDRISQLSTNNVAQSLFMVGFTKRF